MKYLRWFGHAMIQHGLLHPVNMIKTMYYLGRHYPDGKLPQWEKDLLGSKGAELWQQ